MVTLIKYGALSGGEKYNVNALSLDGLSTDTKPTRTYIEYGSDGREVGRMGIPNGSLYTEIDTGDTYMYDADNATWHKVSIGGGGGGTQGGIVLVGETTTHLVDNATTNPITVDGQSYTAQPNDAVIYGNKEFLFDGTKWHEFGDLSGLSSKDIGAMTNYVKAQTGAAIAATDTLNQAIGKVEKRVEVNENNILSINDKIPTGASINNKLATMQDVASMQQYKSWDVKKDNFANTEYKELLLDINTISERESLYAAKDYSVRFQDLPFTIKQITNSTMSSTPFRIAVNTPFKLLGVQEIDVYYYIEDATKITEVRLKALESSATKSVYSFRNGWNKLRFFMEGAGNYDTDANTQTLEIRTYTTNEVTVWIGGVVVVKPQYANIIIIDDGPYYSFYTEAYPTLKANNIPVTWAVDATLLDAAGAVNRSLINMNELELLAIDGLSEFSFHSYDGSTMSSATANEALSDTLNSIRFLRQNGIQPNRIWRAAWMQNNCAHPELANLELDASASYNGAAGVTAYPFPDRYNIKRASIQNRNAEWFDETFEKLRKQHCTILFYTHGVSENSDKDITHTMLTYFINKITAGITAGYLNCTTYSRLVNYYSPIE